MDLSGGVAPRNYADQEETSTSVEMESKWTDEKHSLFLNSMESTFVKQLYESLDSLGWNEPTESKSAKPKHSNIRIRSGKFKATRDDGLQSNIDAGRDEPEVVQEEESRVPLVKNPIKQYRSQERRAIRKPSQYPTHNFCLGGNTEASGQNFVDEDLEEKKSIRLHKKKNNNLIC